MILCTHSPSSRKVKLEGFPRKSQLLMGIAGGTVQMCCVAVFRPHTCLRCASCIRLCLPAFAPACSCLAFFYVLTIITGESVKLLLINSLHSNAMRFSYALKCGFKVLLLLAFVISGSEKRSYHYTRVKITSNDATHH